MGIVKNYTVAEENVAKVARFFLQHFLPTTISAYKAITFFFLANDKNPYPLTYFPVLGSIEYCSISIY